MSKNVVSSSSHPTPSAAANQRPFQSLSGGSWGYLCWKSLCKEWVCISPAHSHSRDLQRTADLARGTPAHTLSFGALSPHRVLICPNTALPNGGAGMEDGVARKEVRKGIFFFPGSAWWVTTGRFMGVFPPLLFFFPCLLSLENKKTKQTRNLKYLVTVWGSKHKVYPNIWRGGKLWYCTAG